MGAEGEKRRRGSHTRSLDFSLKKGSKRERGMLMYHGWLMKWRPLNRAGNASCVVGTKRYVSSILYFLIPASGGQPAPYHISLTFFLKISYLNSCKCMDLEH